MSSTDPDLIPLAFGARLRVRPPDGSTREADSALPVIDVSNLPGARIVARLGYRRDALTLRVLCAAAPAGGWASGVEEIVLARATQLARGALGGEVQGFTLSESTAVGPRFEQRFAWRSHQGDAALAVNGRNWLGFAGDDPREAVVCTVACTEPEATTVACDGLLSEAAAVGTWLEAPPPNLVARGLMLAAQRPREAAGLLLLASLTFAALVIARRPRPRA